MSTSYSKNRLILGGIILMFVMVLVLAAIKNSIVAPTLQASQSNTIPVDAPADWRSIPFVNVRTNQNMTFADFAGKNGGCDLLGFDPLPLFHVVQQKPTKR